ncbi:general substrate transporter [Thozetella sp. PMI_491]|nr:general substrate transporter [Thozetella sp. PMI_491]
MAAANVKHSWYGLSVSKPISTARSVNRVILTSKQIVLALCFSSLTYGYAFSIISTTLGQPGFYSYFDLSPDSTSPEYDYTNRIIGAMNGLFSVGAFMGCWTMGWLCDALGRRKSLLAASTIALIGTALQAGSVHIAMFLVARWLSGHGAGCLVTLVPIMQSEIAPPSTRGFLVGQHGFVLVMGYAIAGWIGYGCYYSENSSFQWRFPLSVGCLWPLISLFLFPWIPESPRWLLMHERKEEAWQIIAKMNSRIDDPDEAFAREEFYQMTQQVEADRKLLESESFWTLFTKPSYRKRMLCGFLAFFSNESSGILVIYNYSVLIYQGLGMGGNVPLLISAIYTTIGAFGNFVNSLLADWIGRKALFITGLTGCLVALIFETALDAQYATSDNKAGLRAAIFFLFVHLTFYACCIDANCFIYCAEIFPTHIRPRGMAWSAGWLFLTTIPYLEAAPTAFAEVGWKYYVTFIVLTAVNIPIIYFLFPETKGLSLEEIGERFNDDVVVHITHITDEERAKLDAAIGLASAMKSDRGPADNDEKEKPQVEHSSSD